MEKYGTIVSGRHQGNKKQKQTKSNANDLLILGAFPPPEASQSSKIVLPHADI